MFYRYSRGGSTKTNVIPVSQVYQEVRHNQMELFVHQARQEFFKCSTYVEPQGTFPQGLSLDKLLFRTQQSVHSLICLHISLCQKNLCITAETQSNTKLAMEHYLDFSNVTDKQSLVQKVKKGSFTQWSFWDLRLMHSIRKHTSFTLFLVTFCSWIAAWGESWNWLKKQIYNKGAICCSGLFDL